MSADVTDRVRDRHSEERSHLDLAEVLRMPSTRVLEIVGDRCAVEEPGAAATAGGGPVLRRRPPTPADMDAELVVFLGRDDDGAASVAVAVAADEARTGTAEGPVSWQTLRDVGPWLNAADVAEFMTAQGMVLWHRTHRFCSRCGAPTTPGSAGWVRVCRQDGREIYPRTDPAVIMAVRDAEDRLLLARSPQWPEGRRSVLAGFVEPGECLEDAVRREVAEEVGIRVGQVDYAGSQPWPFPASLMVGFVGAAETTDIVCEESEIAEAEWFTRDHLREVVRAGGILLPGRMSIARRLIEGWFGERLVVPGVDERGGTLWHRPS